ncbi:TIGR01777 family oxidoreductase [Nonomuraea longicatena]|uniref:TIGR01777 family oxidoreductase n=1 Tax=Nonomuraea longicatena TaxID=83682 RepID=A0ABN1R9G8_9ACTN
MDIVVSGASGMLGSALVWRLRERGDRVLTLVRRSARGGDESRWDPDRGTIDAAAIEGADAVVHLSGAGIAARRWNDAYKRLLVSSRLSSTRTLVTALGGLTSRPKVLVSASGIDFYGDTGDRLVDESAGRGPGFMPDLCKRWEGEAREAESAGIRTAQLRTGMVLGPDGGALARMLPIFRLGLGAPLGDPQGYWSWIAQDDWVGAVLHILDGHAGGAPGLTGPVNLVSPGPVTKAEFTRALGRALGRPTLPVSVPGFALGVGLGEMAGAVLLPSHRAVPKKLADNGYRFAHTGLDQALATVL